MAKLLNIRERISHESPFPILCLPIRISLAICKLLMRNYILFFLSLSLSLTYIFLYFYNYLSNYICVYKCEKFSPKNSLKNSMYALRISIIPIIINIDNQYTIRLSSFCRLYNCFADITYSYRSMYGICLN